MEINTLINLAVKSIKVIPSASLNGARLECGSEAAAVEFRQKGSSVAAAVQGPFGPYIFKAVAHAACGTQKP